MLAVSIMFPPRSRYASIIVATCDGSLWSNPIDPSTTRDTGRSSPAISPYFMALRGVVELRCFDGAFHVTQEEAGWRPVHHTMVEGERKRDEAAYRQLVLEDRRLLGDAADAEDCALRRIHDWCEGVN